MQSAEKPIISNQIKILIVEDNLSIKKQLNFLLQKHGYKCYLASNDTDALNQYKIHKVNLILIDLEIPGTHGINVAKQIRETQSSKYAPLIIIGFSKYHREAMKFFALKNGLNDYICNYSNQTEIITTIDTHIKSCYYQAELATFNQVTLQFDAERQITEDNNTNPTETEIKSTRKNNINIQCVIL